MFDRLHNLCLRSWWFVLSRQEWRRTDLPVYTREPAQARVSNIFQSLAADTRHSSHCPGQGSKRVQLYSFRRTNQIRLTKIHLGFSFDTTISRVRVRHSTPLRWKNSHVNNWDLLAFPLLPILPCAPTFRGLMIFFLWRGRLGTRQRCGKWPFTLTVLICKSRTCANFPRSNRCQYVGVMVALLFKYCKIYSLRSNLLANQQRSIRRKCLATKTKQRATEASHQESFQKCSLAKRGTV